MQAGINHLIFALGAPKFRRRRRIGIKRAVHELLRQLVDHGARRHPIGLALGQFELGVLIIENRIAEGFALACIIQRQLNGTLHRSHSTIGNDQTLGRQLLHKLIKALPLFAAQNTIGRHTHIVEKQF